MTKVSNLNRIKVFAAALLTVSALGISLATTSHAETAFVVPPATQLETVDPSTKLETVVLAGGCFWGVQDVFQHLNGVKSAVSGYAGGNADTAEYETVSTGTSRKPASQCGSRT